MCKLNKYQILYSIKIICAKLLLGCILFSFSAAGAADPAIEKDAKSHKRTQTKLQRKAKPKIKRKAKRAWTRHYLVSGELGHFAFDPVEKYDRESGLLHKSYLLLKAEFEFEPPSHLVNANKYILSAAVRAFYGPEKEEDVSLRSMAVAVVNSAYSLDAGIQEIVWGETFGNSILDIVNPRDYRDPLLDDPLWQRVPVAALNLKIFADQTTYQFVVIPVPKSNLYPERLSFFDPFPEGAPASLSIKNSDRNTSGEDAEFGTRISHLFDNGFDLAFIYYNYFNRNLVFEVDGSGNLQHIQKRMETFGFSFSQAFEEVVVRSDVALHIDQMTQYDDVASARTENVTQAILGLDMTLHGQLILGVQLQGDFYQRETLQWGSFRVEKSWMYNLLKAEFFVFKGIGNDDSWVQPRLSWNATSALSLSLSADLIEGSQKSIHTYLNYWSEKSRYLANMIYRF